MNTTDVCAQVKDPAEVFPLIVDFSAALDGGETILTVAVTSTVVAGVDPDPEDVLAAAASIETGGKSIRQPLEGGLDGVTYHLRIVITTSTPSSRTLVECVRLYVRTC
jgi:hypothetical protein